MFSVWRSVFRRTVVALFSAFLLTCTGCEDNAASDNYNETVSVTALRVTPVSVSLGSSDTYAVFVAQGGSPPYSWSVSDSSLGTVSDTSAATVTYTRIGSTLGGNEVYVSDNNGWAAAAIVLQTDAAGTSSTNGVAGTP